MSNVTILSSTVIPEHRRFPYVSGKAISVPTELLVAVGIKDECVVAVCESEKWAELRPVTSDVDPQVVPYKINHSSTKTKVVSAGVLLRLLGWKNKNRLSYDTTETGLRLYRSEDRKC
ncbi:MAG: hypothetical protein RIB60_07605 [Phycisphaerales bacterium]